MRGCVVKSKEVNFSVMNRIMLRFRPIAPKPPGGDAVCDAAEEERGNGVRRTKRKYVRVRCRQSKRKANVAGKSSPSLPGKSQIEDSPPSESGAVTLQLLPERFESDKSCCNGSTVKEVQENWRIDQLTVAADLTVDIGGGSVTLRNVRSAIGTWIIVESVTDTYSVDSGLGLGFSDREKMSYLQVDTCPGFVSDGRNNVVWVNEAYKKMVAEGEAADGGAEVWLVLKEKLPYFYPSFACRVRLIQHTRHGQKWNRIVPCDVWKMEFEGFAWKLDVNTALRLGI